MARTKQENEIKLTFVEGTATIELSQLLYVESNLHRCIFHLSGGRTLSIYQKLGDIEALLHDSRMLRTHQSYLVNMEYCAEVKSYALTLTSGETLPVPRSRYNMVKEAFLRGQLPGNGGQS